MILGPLREMARNASAMNSNIELFDPPTAYQAAYQQPTGSRFGADAMYHGENRGGGARFSYLFNKKEMPKGDKKDKDKKDKEDSDEADMDSEKEETKVKWDSLTLKLYDGGRLIRTLKPKLLKKMGFISGLGIWMKLE